MSQQPASSGKNTALHQTRELWVRCKQVGMLPNVTATADQQSRPHPASCQAPSCTSGDLIWWVKDWLAMLLRRLALPPPASASSMRSGAASIHPYACSDLCCCCSSCCARGGGGSCCSASLLSSDSRAAAARGVPAACLYSPVKAMPALSISSLQATLQINSSRYSICTIEQMDQRVERSALSRHQEVNATTCPQTNNAGSSSIATPMHNQQLQAHLTHHLVACGAQVGRWNGTHRCHTLLLATHFKHR
jgi:hypothetical protein